MIKNFSLCKNLSTLELHHQRQQWQPDLRRWHQRILQICNCGNAKRDPEQTRQARCRAKSAKNTMFFHSEFLVQKYTAAHIILDSEVVESFQRHKFKPL